MRAVAGAAAHLLEQAERDGVALLAWEREQMLLHADTLDSENSLLDSSYSTTSTSTPVIALLLLLPLQLMTLICCCVLPPGAVTEAGATNALLRAFGSKRVLYGSDWPVAESRGKCITLGDSFLWLTPDNIKVRCSICRSIRARISTKAAPAARTSTAPVGVYGT